MPKIAVLGRGAQTNNLITSRSRVALLAILFLTANFAGAADMTPLALTGFNRDVVIESTASGPPYSDFAQRVNPTENNVFYQIGLSGKSYGLPTDGSFVSAVGDGTTFQFEPYTANNALVLSSDTGLTEGTLALVAPATFGRIAVVANSASGGGPANLTVNFTDGSAYATTYNAPDWFNNSGFALQGTERIDVINGNTSGAPTNPRFYQTSFDLVALLGANNKPIASLTFAKVPSAGSTAVYAVSGEIAPQSPATVLVNPTNTTVLESTTASFSAVAAGVPAPRLQWLRNGAPISGATNSSHAFIAALTDHNAGYRLVASNFANSVSSVATSAPATLTVIADTNRPVLLSAQSQGLGQVLVNYSERVTPASATALTNYALSGPGGAVAISSAGLQAGASNVVLNVPALTEGATYTLVANQVADQSAAANTITNNSTAQFIASIYTTTAIGSATPAGSQVSVGNGLNLSGGGSDIGGTSDVFQYSHIPRTGDFDVKVRLDSLSLADAWSEAGLLARETLSPGARSASVLATPSISGCYFQARSVNNGTTTISGSFPVNYPHTWLRLRRVGNQFTGYAGFDGQNWTTLGTASLTLPATVYLGFAVASHNTNQTATAAFRDFADVTTAGNNVARPREAPGQSSRNTPLVISEIMYHPPTGLLEFVEIFNSRGEPENLSGYQLAGNIQYTFPPGTVLPGGGFLVVAQAPAELEAAHQISGVLGPFTGNLPNSSGTVQLRHRTGAIFLEVNYSDQSPWPLAADGAGHSLILARPSLGEGNPQAWTASDAVGGSPGRLDPISPEPLRGVVINEFLAHTDLPLTDYLELYNANNEPRDLSGAWLSDSVSTLKYQIPPGTTIPARGFLAFTDSTLGFALSAAGERIVLVNSNQTRVIDGIEFGPQENAISFGRVPDGAPEWYRLATRTPGTNNGPALISPVVINELMYHPISNRDDDQYVELHNWTASPIDLTDWRLADGISFTFPPGTIIPAQGYLVVAKNAARLRANYPQLTAANCIGNFGGRLSFSGERMALAKPDYDFVTNNFQIITNISPIVVQEFTYVDSGRWPGWADGGGSSLELRHPHADPRHAANWADSDETAKAPWTVISYTGVLDQGTSAADQLQVLLQDAGECLIDDVEVRDAGNNNRIANSTFQSNANGWTAEGAQSASAWETSEGYNSSRSYRIRAVTGGDNQINRVRTPLTSNLSPGATATIQAKARWLRGSPDLLLRLRGNWLDVGTRLNLPTNLGSPGLPNSQLVPNAPPAIFEVSHSPILPAANEPVVVSARVNDPNGLAAVQLKYRVDPDATYTTVNMTNDSVGNYRATIPGQPAGGLVAFVISATDPLAATSQFPAAAPAREGLVRFGETIPTGNLPVYLIWMTQNTFNHWSSRLKLDNTPLDVTFVLGNQRAIYNADACYVGSPYISPGYNHPAGNRCGYRIQFGKDDAFLGSTDLVLDWPGGHGNENTGVQEQMAYWIADQMDLPYCYRYFIRLQVNGVTDMQRGGVFEAINKPRRQFIQTWYPDDSDGDFYKIERAFEFSDGGGRIAEPMPRLEVFTTPDLATGGTKKKVEKYRWTFMKRASSPADDFSNLFALADALWSPSPEPYTAATAGLVDIDQWMGIFAFERIIMNFDSWGHEIGKNMYAYKPQNGKWQLLAYDLDWLMLVAQNRAGVEALFTPVDDPTVARLFAHPPFRRAYYRAIQKAVAGPLQNAIADPLMDAKYQSLVKNGVTLCDGQNLTAPTAVKAWFNNRRIYLQNQLAAVAAPFTAVAPNPATNGVTTISGAAPLQVATIAINGVPWQVRWTGVNTWTALVPLQPGSNLFQVTGRDAAGNPLPGATSNVSVNYNDPVPAPENHVVINEIQYLPTLPGAQFVELFNTASNHTFDLSGWQFNGLGYTFPGGALLAPRGYLVLAKDRTPFINSFGPQPLVFDTYGGNLQANGETLSLLKPTANPNDPLVVDRVRYEAVAPWPVITNGASLQLRDATQDNSRVANWMAILTPPPPPAVTTVLEFTNVWRFMQVSNLDAVNWTVPAFNDSAWPAGPGLLAFENNASITPLINTVLKDPRIATNDVTSGHAYYFRTTFNFAGAPADFTFAVAAHIDDGAVIYVNGGEAARIRMPAGTILNTTLTQGGQQPPSGDAVNPDLFALPANLFVTGPNVIAVSVHQNVTGSSDITFGLKLAANYIGPGNSLAQATPGAENSVVTNLPAFPQLWLNEVQADNQTGPVDNFGQHDPWVELYNPSASAIPLTGYFLSHNYTNLAQWSFPPGMAIPAGGFLTVWCDNEPAQTVAGVPHTNFRLPSGNGRVALSRLVGGTNQIVDYLTYGGLPSNWSYGDVPDGQPFYRANMFFVTPGATNNSASPPITIFINEWLADNVATLADPADGNFEDWFELYNPGTHAVDLGGYYLTDNLGNPTKFLIPNNGHYVVPPGGYLLVWADNEANQNSTNQTDLHVNFALSKTGEALGLFAADGTQIDAVTFGPQTTDVTEGRFPDGAAAIYAMPTPTPRAANVLPNTPPTLTPIPAKEVTLGQTLTFTAQASDADVPAQTLTFSLGAGAPPGARITPGAGQFSWQPTTAPAHVSISVVVADSGTPSLTATQTFNVTVYLPPTISVQLNGNQMQLTWPRGTLQEADEVTGPYVDVTTNSPLTVDLTETRKFYRIKL